MGSSKINGIDVSLKGISVDSKTTGPTQLNAVSKKWKFDKSGSTPDARQPARRANSRVKDKSSILKLHLAISVSLHKTGPTFNSFPA